MSDFLDAPSSRHHVRLSLALPIASETILNEQGYGSPSKISSLKRRKKPDGWNSITIKKCLLLLAILSYAGVRIALSPTPMLTYWLSSENSYIQNASLPKKTISPLPMRGATTLALLYPPGLLGGYRNQVLRFIAFVVHANENNITQLLLPSLLWTTQIHDPGINSSRSGVDDAGLRSFPIPFSWIFDVDYWNTYSDHLPILVNHSELLPFSADCWLQPLEVDGLLQLSYEIGAVATNPQTNSHLFYFNFSLPLSVSTATTRRSLVVNHLQRAALLQGLIRPLAMDFSIPYLSGDRVINLRSIDFSPRTENCTNPVVYGGGSKAGILWNDYLSYKRRNSFGPVPWNTSVAIDAWIYRALRPAALWRNVAEECVAKHARSGKYIALHARLELEMMGHPCGAGMEKNFSRILEFVYDLYKRQSANSSVSGLFIAVSRSGMEERGTRLYSRFRSYADENLLTLNRITHSQHPRESSLGEADPSDLLPAFECGETALRQYYLVNPATPDHGSLLHSVINFYIAVSAHIFVGVSGSSYSTDILTTRYWLGKGARNYRYTENGVELVEHGGLPVPHSNCKRKRNGS